MNLDWDDPWYRWNTERRVYEWRINANSTAATSVNIGGPPWDFKYPQRPLSKMRDLSPEEIAERWYRRLQLAWDAQEEQWRFQRAEETAERLLLSTLSREQAQEYEEKREFTVISKGSQRRYLIRRGRAHNIYEIDEHGERIHELCVVTRDPMIPVADNILAQKLLLEHSEEEILQIANIWDVRQDRHRYIQQGNGAQVVA